MISLTLHSCGFYSQSVIETADKLDSVVERHHECEAAMEYLCTDACREFPSMAIACSTQSSTFTWKEAKSKQLRFVGLQLYQQSNSEFPGM